MRQVTVISGPSGVGKGTLIGELMRGLPQARLAVSATTRPARPGERDGEHYHFLSEQQFADLEQRGQFLEHARYAGARYGTLRAELDGDGQLIIECDVRGARAVRNAVPSARLLFIAPPSLDELEARLRARGTDDEDKIAQRLRRARDELGQRGRYDHVIVNADVARAAAQLRQLACA